MATAAKSIVGEHATASAVLMSPARRMSLSAENDCQSVLFSSGIIHKKIGDDGDEYNLS